MLSADVRVITEGLESQLVDRVLYIIFNRPDHRNAINLEMWSSIPKIISAATSNDEVRAIAFIGKTEREFSAGADIQEFSTVRRGVENATKYSDAVRTAQEAIINSEKPTLSFIRGWCVGGGAEIAVSCDLRIGDTTAKIGITPAKLGIVYSQLSTTRLVQEVGPSWARYLLLTGRSVSVEVALRSGLLHEAYSEEIAEDEWHKILRSVTRGAPITLAATKKLVGRAVIGQGVDDDYADLLYRKSYASEEYRRGVDSFVTKTQTDFSDIQWPSDL